MSRSPADPNTAISPPPRAAATGARRSRTASSDAGRVGEVDDDPERLAGVDGLHPARHALDGLESRADRRRVEPEPLAEGDHRERVVGVEPAGEADLERGGAGAALVGDAQPPAVLLDAGEPDVGRSSVPYVTIAAPASWATPTNAPADGSSALTIAVRGHAGAGSPLAA